MSLATVVRINKIIPHINADNLEIVPLEGDRQTITHKGQFRPGDLGILIEPGCVVPPWEAYSWMWNKREWGVGERQRTITPRRFRGEWSHALLMAPSELGLSVTDLVEGTDLSDLAGVYAYDDSENVEFDNLIGLIRKHHGRHRCTRQHMPKSIKGWYRLVKVRFFG